MDSTRFAPGEGCDACAPTLDDEDGAPLPGVVNDPFARELGGLSGNAGLFSTGHDVGRFTAMLAARGALDGVRVLKPETIDTFTRAQAGAGTRALGFEIFCQEGTVPDAQGCRKAYAFGHTGYTGTSLWIDPDRRTWVALLTNRTFLPKAPNRLRIVRRHLFNVVTGQFSPDQPEDTAEETR
jgi:CubicO group peptidase (beta-lactamase class C family)